HGILTSTTLMANGEAFFDAVRLVRQTPSLDIGCHLVLVGGGSMLSGPAFSSSGPQLLCAPPPREVHVYHQLAAQVRPILEAGLPPTHLDTHKHTHLAPPVLDAVARIAEEFGIRWVRRPFDFPLNALRGGIPWIKRATNAGLGLVRHRFHKVLERHGCRT